MYSKLGLMEESDLLLAGPSNIGLSEPAQAAEISLLQVSAAMWKISLIMDHLVGLKAMTLLADRLLDRIREREDGT